MKPIVPTADMPDAAFSRQMARAVSALPDVPPALEQAAIALFKPQTAGAAAGQALAALAQGVLIHVRAVLSFDSWAAPAAAAGMRSLRSPTRHLLFSAQGRDIDLRIAPQPAGADSYALAGQILGPDERGSVELSHADAAAAARVVALDSLGEFRFEGLARGSYRLTLLTASERIELPSIEVGAPAGEPAR